jgi:chromosome partitioning protein
LLQTPHSYATEYASMPVIAVINRKGGSGKSTLATHLAAWLACQGVAVMLGDVDRQQSTRAWLKRRDIALPAIMPWAVDQKNVLKAPPGVTHVVLDTPGGLHGFELAKVVMSADVVIMPVCHSMFDRESAGACYAELMTLPRVASGRCKLGIVGMRIDARTRAGLATEGWADALNVSFLGVLREAQIYVKSLENGRTIFDSPTSNAVDLLQWEPILDWLRPLIKLGPMPAQPTESAAMLSEKKSPAQHINTPRPASLMPAQEAFVHGDRLSVIASARPALEIQSASDELVLGRALSPHERYTGPQFLLRH